MVPFRSDFTARTSTAEPSAPLQGPAVGASTSSDSAAPGGFDDVLRGITNTRRDAQPEAPRDGSSTSSETTASPDNTTPEEIHAESSEPPTAGTPAASSRSASTKSTKSDTPDAPATTAVAADPAADAASVIAPPPPPAPKPLVLQMMDLAAARANQAANGQAAQAPSDGSTTPGAPSLSEQTDLFGTASGTNGSGTPLASVASRFLARFPSATNQPNGVKSGVSFGRPANTTSASGTSAPSTTSSSNANAGAPAAATSAASSTASTQPTDAAAAAVLAAMQASGAAAPVTPPAAQTSGTNHAQGTDGREANAVGDTASGEALTQATKMPSTIAQSASGDASAAGSANAFDDELSAVTAAGHATAASGAPAVDDATIAAALRAAAKRTTGGTNKATSSSATSTTTAPTPTSTDGKSLSTLVGTSVATAAKSSAPAGADPARPAPLVTAGGSRPTFTISMPDLMSASTNRSTTAAIEAPALLASDTDAPAVMSQIVQAMRVQAAQGGGTAQVTLQPGYLGGVTLSVKVDSDGVSASVVADTPAVRDALRSQEPALRQALGDQGLKLEHFDVSEPAETPRKQSGGQQQAPQEQPRPRQQKRRDPSEPAFEFVA